MSTRKRRKRNTRTLQQKAQVLGTVFVLILGAMVFILILLYGYKAINTFLQKGEQVTLIEFQTDLESSVKEISLDFGSVKKVTLKVPSSTREVCFVTEPRPPGKTSFEEEHPLLYDAYQAGSQNVFLVPLTESSIYLERIDVQGGWFCEPASSGRIDIRLEGLGNKAGVSPWTAG